MLVVVPIIERTLQLIELGVPRIGTVVSRHP